MSNTAPAVKRRVYTPDYLVGAGMIAAYVGDVHPQTVLKALRSGQLRGHQRTKLGTWRARPEDVVRWAAGLKPLPEREAPRALPGRRTA